MKNNKHRMFNLARNLLRSGGLICACLMLPSAFGAVRTWSGAAGSVFWSSDGNWSPLGAPGPSDNVTFTNVAYAEAPLYLGGLFNTAVDAAFSGRVNSLSLMNIEGFHNLELLKPLLVIGTSGTDVAFMADDGQPAILFVGSGRADGPNDSVYASIAGDALTVSNRNANLSVMQASQTSGSHRATLDMTGLNSLVCVLSNVLVGHDFGVPITRPTGTLMLAATNAITAKMISVADAYQNAGAASYLHLGRVNVLNVDRIRIALHKCVGTVDFTPGWIEPSVTFRNFAGNGRQVSWEIGDEYEPDTSLGYFTSSQSTGILDLSGGRVDALVDRITLGRGQTNAATRTGDGNGTLTFGKGKIDVNYLEMGIQVSAGGSVGRGVLNINNEDGAGATMTVNGDVLMAVQLPGNTDASGSSAIISLEGGRMTVGGNMTDGAGLSTINLNNGGLLDLKPAGDTTAGNITVDILNLNGGDLVNYGVLSVSNITLSGAADFFRVVEGQTLAPIAPGTIGNLKVTGNLHLRGTTDIDISKTGSTLLADRITVSGSADLGGTLRVRLAGSTALSLGDRFTLFTAASIANGFSTLLLPASGPGLAWTNRTSIDGSIEVVASNEPAERPRLTISATATSITVAWPAEYTTYVLRRQTNPPGAGLGGNWETVPGVVGNRLTFPIPSSGGSVFFQLLQQ